MSNYQTILTCPYCNTRGDDHESMFTMSEDDYQEVDCGACDKTYMSLMVVTTNFDSYTMDEFKDEVCG